MSSSSDVLDTETQSVLSDHSRASIAPTSTIESTSIRKRSRRRSATPEGDRALKNALTGFISQTSKTRQEQLTEKSARDPEDLQFSCFAMRLKKLPSQIQSLVQLQISQLFFNAENRDLPPVPITPLPPVVPQAHYQSQASTSFDPDLSSSYSQSHYATQTSDIISSAYQLAQL